MVEPIESEFTLQAAIAQTAYGDVFAQLAGVDDDDERAPDPEPDER